MSTIYSTSITLIGNKRISDLAIEIRKRYDDLIQAGYDSESTQTVCKLFYGDDEDCGDIHAKWFYLEEYDRDTLYFKSANWPILEIQEHILKCASILDPKLIVFAEYRDESPPSELGSSYKLIDEGNIISFESDIDLTNFYIVEPDEDEDQFTLADNEITMEDVYNKWNMNRKELFDKLKKKYTWAKDDYFANWK